MIAQAPILSSVSRSSAHRSFWAIVPFDMIAADVSPMLTPIAVTMPGQHSAQLDDRDQRHAGVAATLGRSRRGSAARGLRGSFALDLALEAVAGHVVHAERGEQLAQDVVRRHVAVLEFLDVRADLVVDEPPDRVDDHAVFFGPLVHWRPLVRCADRSSARRRSA